MFEQLHFNPYLQKKILRSFFVTRYKLVTSSRNLLKRHINMFNMSIWHNGRMRSLEYVEIHFPMVLYFLLLILKENYTLQPQNEIQIQYYHSEQVSLMVHITNRHGPNSSEEQREILKEYHFYISNDRCQLPLCTSLLHHVL